jgi:broad specificity phosphatase PhoE
MRTYLFVSAAKPFLGAIAVSAAPTPPDLCVTSPSPRARATAAFACAGRSVRTVDEPLLARPDDGESSGDVAARFARALGALHVLNSRFVLVVVDEVGLRGRSGFELDDVALLRDALRIAHDQSLEVC